MQKFKVNASITDLAPLFLGMDSIFKGMKSAGVDGLELLVGVKSRWSYKKIAELSQFYDLPIVTLHQPIWSGLGFILDGDFLRLAQKFHVKGVVLHPQTFLSLEHTRMKKYLKTFSNWQKAYGIPLMLENSPKRWGISSLLDTLAPIPPNTASLVDIYTTAQEYGFFLTFDSAHAALVHPQDDKAFLKVFPKIRNIHLSSFTKSKDHLPLDMGELDARSFISWLYKKNYDGHINLEIYYPKHVQLLKYDYDAIRRSVTIVKSVKG